MKAEEARRFADQALNRLAEALAAGQSESLTKFLAAMGKFHRYSFHNVMLILLQRPDASNVAGFQTWKSLGRFVRKGEKGIAIIAPMFIAKQDADSKTGEDSVVRFRAVHVFDESQTDGEPLPDVNRVSGDPGTHLDRLRHVIRERGIGLSYESLASADGLSRGGTIVVKEGLTPAEDFAVLAHELAHEILHHGSEAVRGPKVVMETEAEAVSFVVTSAVGISTGTAAVDYIQLYSGDAKTLGQSLDRIQKAATAILTAILDDSDA